MIRRNKPWPIAPVITAVLLLGCISGFAQSPVNQWVFSPENIDITTVKDLSGNEDGLLHGRMAPSKNPPALYFDGTDTYVELAGKDEAKSLPKSKLTAEAWVAVNSPAEWGGIVGSLQDNGSFEKGWVLGYNNDKFNFALSTGGDLTYLNASDSFQTGHWYHVVGTYDGSLMRIYVNGTERGRSSKRRGTIDYSPAAFVIGCYLDDNEFYPLEGFISEVRLYNRALTSQQVRTRYNRTKGSHTVRPKPPVALTNRELSAGPYLAFTSPDEAVVRWETAKPMPTRLAYGTTPTLQNRIDLPKKTRQHEVLLPASSPVQFINTRSASSRTAKPSGLHRRPPKRTLTIRARTLLASSRRSRRTSGCAKAARPPRRSSRPPAFAKATRLTTAAARDGWRSRWPSARS